MYANVFHMRTEGVVDEEKAVQILQDQVLPRARRFPGLLTAYWLHSAGDEALVFMFFRDENHARAPIQFIGPGFSPIPGVFVRQVETVEVVAYLDGA